ncbi:MAG: non-heme chloroperoxidase [Gammaproteobacteria bacterium]|jgi:non-heme chloroperoxidase
MDNTVGPFDVSTLFPLQDQISEMAPLEPITARDVPKLFYRRYSCTKNVHLVLAHDPSAHSAYLRAFANFLAANEFANVYALDLREHGPNPKRRGDIDYIDRLEDDIADFIARLKKKSPEGEKIILGGRYSGCGLALRVGGGKHGHMVQGV